MLITEAKGQAHVSVYLDGRLVDYGWVDVSEWKSKTVSNYDWSRKLGK